MSETIERMGRAMADYACVNYQHNQAIYDAYARAAIEAVRKPTKEIKSVVTRSIDYTAGEIWEMMIDAALKETK